MRASELAIPHGLELVEITEPVRVLREKLAIPDKMVHESKAYPIFPPRVIVFQRIDDIGLTVGKITEQALVDLSKKAHVHPTGETFVPIYPIMCANQVVRERLFKVPNTTIDEYHPIRPGEPNFPIAYAVYSDKHIGVPLGIPSEAWIRPDGSAEDGQAEAERFDQSLARVDIAVVKLGIGPDPKTKEREVIPAECDDEQIRQAVGRGEIIPGSSHIGFVPSGTSPEAGVLYVTLDQGTVFKNSEDAPDPEHFPGHAITQAHRHFRRGEIRVLVATRPFKQRGVEKVLFQPPTVDNPSSLVTLGETVILLDTQAAGRVMDRLKKENLWN